MGPDRNAELYAAVAPLPETLTDEFVRRNLVTPALRELSELFEAGPHSPSQLTDTTLLLRLHALALVQAGPMGVFGFDPSHAVSFDRRAAGVQATAAPHHDEFRTPAGETVRTRTCRLEIPDEGYGKVIEVFALNVYTPDGDSDTVNAEKDKPKPATQLLIVGKDSRVGGKSQPITGSVVAFGVRNKVTGDTKLYSVAIHQPGQGTETTTQSLAYAGKDRALVALPGGLSAEVTVLSGELQQQFVSEVAASTTALRDVGKTELSAEERAAIGEIRTDRDD